MTFENYKYVFLVTSMIFKSGFRFAIDKLNQNLDFNNRFFNLNNNFVLLILNGLDKVTQKRERHYQSRLILLREK